MTTISELRAQIASGEVKVGGGGGGPKVGPGTFETQVIESSYGKGFSGNDRGLVKVKVIGGGTVDELGGMINIYLPSTENSAPRSIAEWQPALVSMGIGEDKIWEECDDSSEVVANICAIVTKLAKRGMVLTIERKEQPKLDAQGRKQYWNNITGAAAVAHSAPSDAPVSAAQMTAVASLAAPAAEKIKPWKK